jgi:branched-subunit amino acid ABC-type transport system permease component
MQLLVNALIAGSVAALLASALSLVYGVLGVFNVALGQLALIGGYIAWWSMQSFGLPLWAGAIVSTISTITVGSILFEVAVEPFYKRHPFLPILTTIAASVVFDGLIILAFGEQPTSIVIPGGDRLLHVGSGVISVEQVVLIAGSLLFLVSLAAAIQGTRFGRQIRASVQHGFAAESLGMNARFLHRFLFGMSVACAGFAGMFLALDQNITPVLGFPLTVKAYAAVIAGGRGSVGGAVFCAFIIALLEQLAVGIPWFGVYIPAGYQSTVALAMIVIVLLWRPQGLFVLRARRA